MKEFMLHIKHGFNTVFSGNNRILYSHNPWLKDCFIITFIMETNLK